MICLDKYSEEDSDEDLDLDQYLDIAIVEGHVKIVKYLIEQGADINKNINNRLLSTIYDDHLGMFEFLLLKGADFNSIEEWRFQDVHGENIYKLYMNLKMNV